MKGTSLRSGHGPRTGSAGVANTAGSRRCRTLLAGLVGLLLAGCATFSTHLSADPLEPGQVDIGLVADVVSMFDVPQQSGLVVGVPAVRARVGLLRNVDVGMLAHPEAVEAGTRIRLLNRETRLALAPSAGLGRTPEGPIMPAARFIHVHVPVIVTRTLPGDRRLNFGPRLTHSRFMPRGGGESSGTLLGTFVGVEIPARQRFWLSPELGVHRTVDGDVPVDGWVVHFGLGAGWRSPSGRVADEASAP